MGTGPRLSLRLVAGHTASATQWAKTLSAIAENPGCCVEAWFSTGVGLPPLAWHREHVARIASAAADLRRLGIAPSLQIQATLGHDDAISVSENCSAKEWTGWTGSTGVEAQFCSCPRQPAFLDYFRACARIYAPLRFVRVWIDDDLRDVRHPPATDGSYAGCWCATCLSAFGEQEGQTWTREALNAAMGTDPAVAARWTAFSAQSLADVARAIAAEFRNLSPETRMGYQAVFWEEFAGPVPAIVLESPFVGLMMPHVTASGALRTVALLNTRIDVQGPVTLRLRGVPDGARLVWRELRRAPRALSATRDGDVVRVTVPSVGAWNGGFVDFCKSGV